MSCLFPLPARDSVLPALAGGSNVGGRSYACGPRPFLCRIPIVAKDGQRSELGPLKERDVSGSSEEATRNYGGRGKSARRMLGGGGRLMRLARRADLVTRSGTWSVSDFSTAPRHDRLGLGIMGLGIMDLGLMGLGLMGLGALRSMYNACLRDAWSSANAG